MRGRYKLVRRSLEQALMRLEQGIPVNNDTLANGRDGTLGPERHAKGESIWILHLFIQVFFTQYPQTRLGHTSSISRTL